VNHGRRDAAAGRRSHPPARAGRREGEEAAGTPSHAAALCRIGIETLAIDKEIRVPGIVGCAIQRAATTLLGSRKFKGGLIGPKAKKNKRNSRGGRAAEISGRAQRCAGGGAPRAREYGLQDPDRQRDRRCPPFRLRRMGSRKVKSALDDRIRTDARSDSKSCSSGSGRGKSIHQTRSIHSEGRRGIGSSSFSSVNPVSRKRYGGADCWW